MVASNESRWITARTGPKPAEGFDAAPAPAAGGEMMAIPTTAPSNTLLSVQTRGQADAQDEAKRQAALPPRPVILSIATHIERCYQEARNERVSSGVDERLIDAMRRRKGEYTPEKLAAIEAMGGSAIYTLLTEEKCAGAEAWIADYLIPSDGKPWAIEPTPIPDLPEFMQQKVVKDTMAQVQAEMAATGQPVNPDAVFEYASNLRERYLAAMQEMAKTAAEGMTTRIEDQLAECKFMDLFYESIRDLTTYGTALIEGPILRKYRQKRWQGGNMFVSDGIRIEFDRISPLDAYPAPGAMNPDDGYFCHRIRNYRRQIAGLKGLAGVNDAAVDRVLTEYTSGWRRYEFPDAERRRLGDQTLLNTNNDEIIEGVKFKGCIQGRMLREWGMTGLEDLQEYECMVTMYGHHVVRAQLNPDPLYRRNIFKGVFEPVLDSFWGRGVPHLMADIQDICNATVRALVDNEGLASRPQAIIDDIGRLPRGTNLESIHPGHIWQFINPNGISRNKAVEFFMVPSNAQELMQIHEYFSGKADNRTRIPAYTYGTAEKRGAGETASGLGMLMNAASRSIKRIIAGVDRDLVVPLIEAVYDFNMLYDPDQTIKGDVNIIGKGAIGIMIHEQKVANIAGFLLESNNPTDSQIIDLPRRANIWRERAKMLGMPVEKVVPTDEEMRKRVEAIATLPPSQPPGGGPAGGNQQ